MPSINKHRRTTRTLDLSGRGVIVHGQKFNLNHQLQMKATYMYLLTNYSAASVATTSTTTTADTGTILLSIILKIITIKL